MSRLPPRAGRRSLSYSDKGIIRCVSTHALASCGVGNTVEGFINHDNIRVSEVYSYTETTEEDKALSALYKLRFLSQPSSAPFLGPNYTNHQ